MHWSEVAGIGPLEVFLGLWIGFAFDFAGAQLDRDHLASPTTHTLFVFCRLVNWRGIPHELGR